MTLNSIFSHATGSESKIRTQIRPDKIGPNMALETEHLGGLCHVEIQGDFSGNYFRGCGSRGSVVLPCRTEINHE